MHTFQQSIEESLKETKNYLEKLYDEISRTLEKISSREKYINSQLEDPMLSLRNYQEKLNEIKDAYKVRSGGINERTQTLSQVLLNERAIYSSVEFNWFIFLKKITNELQRIKEEMEEAGQSMTDGCKSILIVFFNIFHELEYEEVLNRWI